MDNILKYAIGIDLGGTFIKFGLISSNGDLVYKSILPTEAETSSQRVIENLITAVKDVQKYAHNNKIELVGIGIGTPGIIDKTYRIVVSAANIAGWSNVLLADKIESACKLPAWINNDANMMGLGEQAFGAAKNFSDVLFLTIGTGIGGSVIINNQLFGGGDNRGAELGHTPLNINGIKCSCGSVGCLESYASTTALINQFNERLIIEGVSFSEEITGKLIIKLCKENNPIAVETLNEHCRFLGHGIAGLVNIFSPQRVVLGGGISESGDFYIEKIKNEFNQYVLPSCAVNTEICAAKLGNNAGMIGAAQWAFQSSSIVR